MAAKEEGGSEGIRSCPVASDPKGSEQKEVHYSSYLQLEKILTAQTLRSKEVGGKAIHDEHFFIVIHQVYELWFKQILVELESVIAIMGRDAVDRRDLLTVVSRQNRIIQIKKIMISQITVLETLIPLDFLEFRGFLAPASGFQSTQFRLLEIMLGLKEELRVQYAQCPFTDMLNSEEKAEVEVVRNKMTLLQAITKWLERTPGLEVDGFNFWSQYQKAVEKMLKDSEDEIKSEENDTRRAILEKDHKKQKKVFDDLFSEEEHERQLKSGDVRLSYKALQGAIMIYLYREEPCFHLPFLLLTQLLEIDAHFMKWRFTHVTMVQRMIGSRVGTGGSSGYHYLRSTTGDHYKVFLDLFNLSTYLLPKSKIPKLTNEMIQELNAYQAPPPHLKLPPDEGSTNREGSAV